MSNTDRIIELADQADTERLAAGLADRLPSGSVIALSGDLGAGKTTFARAFIRRRVGGDVTVPSPTFTLVQSYEGPMGTVHHFDLYRLSEAAEILELDWDDALAGDAVLVEWPDRLGSWLPPERLDVALAFAAGTDGRTARLTGPLAELAGLGA